MAGIKGTTKELYIKKESANILTLTGSVKTVLYSDMKRIDYCFAETFHLGYITFITKENKSYSFEFGKKTNEEIRKVINVINKNFPNIPFREYQQGENTKDKSITVTAIFGYKEVGCKLPNVIIKQKINGDVYFNNITSVFYDLIGYEWNGPEFDMVTNSTSSERFVQNTKGKKNGKSLKIGAGALIGSAFGPAGTVIGAAMGAGGKTKTKEKTSGKTFSNSSETTSNVEKFTNAILSFRNQDDGTEYRISFKCNREIDSKIKCLSFKLDDE